MRRCLERQLKASPRQVGGVNADARYGQVAAILSSACASPDSE